MKKIALPIPLIALPIGVSSTFWGVSPPPPLTPTPPLSFAHDAERTELNCLLLS